MQQTRFQRSNMVVIHLILFTCHWCFGCISFPMTGVLPVNRSIIATKHAYVWNLLSKSNIMLNLNRSVWIIYNSACGWMFRVLKTIVTSLNQWTTAYINTCPLRQKSRHKINSCKIYRMYRQTCNGQLLSTVDYFLAYVARYL